MAEKTALRIAVPIEPPYIEMYKVSGREFLKGLPIFVHELTIFEKAGFNLTLVPVEGWNIGVADENGTYDGLWGEVQSGNADTTIFGAPLTIPPSVGRLSKVFVATEALICSKRAIAKEIDGSLYYCLTALGFTVNVILLTLILMASLILITAFSKRAIWPFFSMIVQQNFIQINNRLGMLTLTSPLLFVATLFGCQYSTDVTIAVPVRNINTLNDLLESDKKPSWLRMDFQIDYFKQRVTETYAQVYDKVRNDPRRMLHVGGLMEGIENLETRALVVSKHFVASVLAVYCSSSEFRENIQRNKRRIYTSKPFASTPGGLLKRRNVSAQVSKKLDRLAMRWLEHSLFGNQWESGADEFVNSKQPQCVDELGKPVQSEPGQTLVTMKFVPLTALLCICAFAFLLLLLELGSALFLTLRTSI